MLFLRLQAKRIFRLHVPSSQPLPFFLVGTICVVWCGVVCAHTIVAPDFDPFLDAGLRLLKSEGR
jgi:hypothetical protein